MIEGCRAGRRWSKCKTLLVVVLIGLTGNIARGEGNHPLASLLNERLSLMRDVAAYKWQHGLSIEDSEREAVVVARAVAEGRNLGLEPDTTRRMFEAQINAAKVVQHYWFERWLAGEDLPLVGQLEDDFLEEQLRPRLLHLGKAILNAAASEDRPHKTELIHSLTVEGLDESARAALVDAVLSLRRYPNRLSQILDLGQLRIGTTGDYPPFTFRANEQAPLLGLDIDMAKDLAASLGVEPVFVATSWPALTADLEAGRFDIAMGGVSRTLERQRIGFLSLPYHDGGKTVVAPCAGADRYSSLQAVDQPGVRVIVNPGGTNEQFVDRELSRAQKIPHQDNRTIFAALLRGDADLMITDRIEGQWQVARHPELCLPMGGNNLTYQEKAYLMPQDSVLKAYVDTWLSLRIATGEVDALFRRWLDAPIPGEP